MNYFTSDIHFNDQATIESDAAMIAAKVKIFFILIVLFKLCNNLFLQFKFSILAFCGLHPPQKKHNRAKINKKS